MKLAQRVHQAGQVLYGTGPSIRWAENALRGPLPLADPQDYPNGDPGREHVQDQGALIGARQVEHVSGQPGAQGRIPVYHPL